VFDSECFALAMAVYPATHGINPTYPYMSLHVARLANTLMPSLGTSLHIKQEGKSDNIRKELLC
jgi:hypothetical protein